MLVSKISNSNRNTFLFGRKLRKDEEQDYRENALQPAFDYLGTEEVAMIVHGTSYPEKLKIWVSVLLMESCCKIYSI